MKRVPRQAAAHPIGTREQATAYCRAMEDLHKDGERWLVFRVPQGSMARGWGEFSTCRESERADYEKGGAEFIE